MRTQGYCDGCHRIRTVTVTPRALAYGPTRGVLTGTCDDCSENERWRGRSVVLRHRTTGEEIAVRVNDADRSAFYGFPLAGGKAGRITTYRRPLWRAVR